MSGTCQAVTCVLAACLSLAAAAGDLPGDTTLSMQLRSELEQALTDKGADYLPGTRHLLDDGRPSFTNRLILEDSPYLAQHAHNPVNWYAWGEEAFERARKENKPVFLSIGYSTCHWCHVMKRESFEDIGIAGYLNEHFIAVKVDRERRPDIDEIYMSALLLTQGRGGWPLSSFLTLDGEPFFSGAYYPPEEFLDVLKQIRAMWETQQDDLALLAAKIAAAVKNSARSQRRVADVGPELVRDAVAGILQRYDKQWGGLGNAPKFTNEASLMLLLQYGFRNTRSEPVAAAEHTLTMMARGGVYDQVAGGFHRYSTDRYWLVPHFEKMLYHQANMARVYLSAYRFTGNSLYARIAGQTLNFVLRDMSSPSGGFYSAIDAESDGEEGRFYVWTAAEIRQALTGAEGRLAQTVFGITEQGNFNGRNILHLPHTLSETAKTLDIGVRDLVSRLDGIREKLRREREKRTPPLTDKKILLAWNGMMITSLARSAQLLQRHEYLQAALRTADYLWKHQRTGDGALLRINYEGRASSKATQDDYAFFAEGLLALYDVTGERLWLNRAMEVTGTMVDKFWDTGSGGFYLGEDRDTLFVTPKQIRDGDVPSGNSAALHVLAGLSRRAGDWEYHNLANQLVRSFSPALDDSQVSSPWFMGAVDELLHNAAGSTEYAARGEIKLAAQTPDNGRNVKLRLDISPGWHINSFNPGQTNLVPLGIEIAGGHSRWQLARLSYPEPRLKKLSFADARLALYENRVDLELELVPPPELDGYHDRRVDISVRLQACNDEICLAPEDIVLEHLYRD